MSHRRRRWLLLGAIALLVAIALFAGRRFLAPFTQRAFGLGDFTGANVLLVTLDTTRADRLGCYGYSKAETPHLDAIASEGVLFEQAITPSAFTLPSHASIMTGFYPPYHGIRLNGHAALADAHITLAERMTQAGYRCGAFVGAFVLDGRWGLEQGFEHFDDEFKLKPGQKLDLAGVQRTADQVVDAAVGWLEQPDERPFFAWLHFYDPHTPYDPPEPFKSKFGGENPDQAPPSATAGPGSQIEQLKAWRQHQNALYDGEIAWTDSQVGRLMRWLEAQGISDDTIVIVVGDHGEAIGSHGEIEHGYYVYDYAMKVPLMIRLPGAELAGVRVGAQVRTIDVLPTVTQLLAIESVPGTHGESLVSMLSGPESAQERYAYAESMAPNLQYGWSALYSVRTPDYKFIDAPRSELYSLATDSDELQNVYAQEFDKAQELREVLDRIRDEIAEGAPEAEEANIDDQTLAMLASLGYVGGATGSTDGEDLADPKDKLHLYQAVGLAGQLISEDDHHGAARQLEMVLAEDPAIPQARLLLASSYKKVGRRDDAKSILDEYLREDPESVQALITMAGLLAEEGSTEEVLAICRRTLAVDERNTQAYSLMASVHMKTNEHSSALPFLRKALEIQPKLSRTRNNLAACLVGLQEFDEAHALLDGVLSNYPKFPLANFHLGLLHEEQGRPAEARRAYEREVELNPESVKARFNLGNLLFRIGDMSGGEQQMRGLIEVAPELARPYLLLSRALLARNGDPREVEDLAQKGLERAQTSELKALGYFLLADAYSRQGRRDEIPGVLRSAREHQARIGPNQES